MEDQPSKSDIYFAKSRNDLFTSLKYYKERQNNLLGRLLINIRLDGVGENISDESKHSCLTNGIQL